MVAGFGTGKDQFDLIHVFSDNKVVFLDFFYELFEMMQMIHRAKDQLYSKKD